MAGIVLIKKILIAEGILYRAKRRSSWSGTLDGAQGRSSCEGHQSCEGGAKVDTVDIGLLYDKVYTYMQAMVIRSTALIQFGVGHPVGRTGDSVGTFGGAHKVGLFY